MKAIIPFTADLKNGHGESVDELDGVQLGKLTGVCQ
jgi:hypothetical protein